MTNVNGLLKTQVCAAGDRVAPCEFGVLTRSLSSVLVAGGQCVVLLLRNYYTRA